MDPTVNRSRPTVRLSSRSRSLTTSVPLASRLSLAQLPTYSRTLSSGTTGSSRPNPSVTGAPKPGATRYDRPISASASPTRTCSAPPALSSPFPWTSRPRGRSHDPQTTGHGAPSAPPPTSEARTKRRTPYARCRRSTTTLLTSWTTATKSSETRRGQTPTWSTRSSSRAVRLHSDRSIRWQRASSKPSAST